ncbi:unnamed protein product [Linum trigynum]|uniref:Cystatin domain-containing protein n=1 Tax=Linum trigynum TaxID=586398 RepID=A0AAV2C7R3_9ROSI
MRTTNFLVASITVAIALVAVEAVGVWTPISNPTDEHVKEIAKFAIETYNTQSGADPPLRLVSVNGGEKQFSATLGTKYKLKVTTEKTDGSGVVSPSWLICIREGPSNVKYYVSFEPMN